MYSLHFLQLHVKWCWVVKAAPRAPYPQALFTGGLVRYWAGQDRRGKSHHPVIRSPDRPAHIESFLYVTECSTCVYHCDFIGSCKYMNLLIIQKNGRVNYELQSNGDRPPFPQLRHTSFQRSYSNSNSMVRGSNPGIGEIFHTRPDRSGGPPSLLHNGDQFFPGGKAAEAWL